MTEAELVKEIVKALREQVCTEAMKIHGDMYQERGIPDILCCHRGKFFAFEVKRPGKEKNVSTYQRLKLNRIRKAWGKALVISSVREALLAIRGATLEQNIVVSEQSIKEEAISYQIYK